MSGFARCRVALTIAGSTHSTSIIIVLAIERNLQKVRSVSSRKRESEVWKLRKRRCKEIAKERGILCARQRGGDCKDSGILRM
ncbi:hypothetical protein U1Q18_017574 [Sarracenia purpurea var. burkii]